MDQPPNPIGPAAEIEERREMPRCAVDVPATLVVISVGTTITAHMTELSLSGCRLQFQRAVLRAAPAAVECTFKIRGVGFRLGGLINWAENNQAGVQFKSMSPRSRDDLMEVLCEIELENNATQLDSANAEAGAPVAEARQGTASTESIIAEAAARPSASSPDFASPPVFPSQKVAEPNRHLANANPGRDRRTAHRCDVDTSAIIELVKAGSRLSGQIVDLSLGGCRIRTAERFPVGIYTRIETEFKLRGIPFRLGGVIQVIHDRNTVGIRFLDMSQRKKDQVSELIGEIEEAGN
jgi:hypothetical protein